MESILDAYVNREIECIHQSIELWNDKELLTLKNKLLPLVCEQGHIDFYKPILEEAEKHYDNAVKSMRERTLTENKYGMYDDILRVLDNSKEDVRRRLEAPVTKKIAEWRTKRCVFLENNTEPQQRPSVCIEYAYCKNNTSGYMYSVQLYKDRRKEYENTGKAYPSIAWLLEYEKEVFPWGFPDHETESIVYTRPISRQVS